MSSIKPGVYTSYTLSQTTTTSSSVVVGIVAYAGEDTDVKQITSYAAAKSAFGETATSLLQYLKAFFTHASGVVYARGVDSDYASAFTELLTYPISVLCSDCTDSDTIADLGSTLVANANAGSAVVAVVGCADGESAEALAYTYNCERVCLTTQRCRKLTGWMSPPPS